MNRIDLLVAGIVGLVLVSFWRGLLESYDLTKAIILWIGSAIVLTVYRGKILPWRLRQPRDILLLATFAVLIFASLVTTDSYRTLLGQDHRYTGTVTLFATLILFLAVSRGLRSLHGISLTLAFSSLIGSTYGILQMADRDPFVWGTESFGDSAFGTAGNPNLLAAHLATTIPFTVSLLFERNLWKRLLAIALLPLSFVAISGTGSFQGFVGVLALISSLLIYGRRTRDRYSLLSLLTFLLTAGSGSLVILSNSWGEWIPFAVLLGGSAAASVWLASRQLGPSLSTQAGLLLILGTMGLGGFVFSGQVFAGITDGMRERSAFYRSAWAMFRDSPWIGRGLETFGNYFTLYRPAWHAIELEGSRTNSVHSVPLALLASGGVVVGALFLLITCSVVVSAIRKNRGRSDSTRLSFLVAFVSLTLIFLVSIEAVLLFVLFAVFAAGCVWDEEEAKSVVTGRKVSTSRIRGRNFRSRRSKDYSQLLVALLMASLSIFFTVRVFAAERKFQSSLDALFLEGDYATASISFSELIGSAPSEPKYRIEYANTLSYLGDNSGALEQMIAVVELTNYNGAIVPPTARLALQVGRIDLALDLMRRAVNNDPFAPGLRDLAVGLSVELREQDLIDDEQFEELRREFTL
jgi:hypothetical protein